MSDYENFDIGNSDNSASGSFPLYAPKFSPGPAFWVEPGLETVIQIPVGENITFILVDGIGNYVWGPEPITIPEVGIQTTAKYRYSPSGSMNVDGVSAIHFSSFPGETESYFVRISYYSEIQRS